MMGPHNSRKDGEPKRRQLPKRWHNTSYRAEKTAGRQDGDCQHDGTSYQAEGMASRKDGESTKEKGGLTDDEIHAEVTVGLKQEQK